MKKIVLSVFILASFAAGMQSCLDHHVQPLDEDAAGWSIYQMARTQNLVATDGANIAFRLHMLLSNVEPGKIEETDLENVMVSDDESGVQRNLSKILFGQSKIEQVGGDVYRIIYPDYGYNSYDYQRYGTVLVHTMGKLLTELGDPEDGYFWTVTNDYLNASNPKMRMVVSTDGYGEETTAWVRYGDNYSIFPSEDNTATPGEGNAITQKWTVEASDFQSEYNVSGVTPAVSDWAIGMTIETNLLSWNYNAVNSAETYFVVTGSGSGAAMFLMNSGEPVRLFYQIPSENPMVHQPGISCGWSYVTGKEYARMVSIPADKNQYPSLEVEVTWAPRVGTCGVDVSLEYIM